MSRREAWASAALVFIVALIIRAAFAANLHFPTPEDTAYYVSVARNLVAGRGLVSDAIWSYQTPPLVFPRPAFEVWLPLPSLLGAAAMAVAGPTFAAARVAAVLVGATVAVLAWRLAADLGTELGLPAGRRRNLAIGSGLAAAVELPLVLFGALPDSTMVFAALALAGCLLMTRILARAPGDFREAVRDRRLLGLGVVLGLAALARNEAAWLAAAWVVAVAMAGPRGVAGSQRLADQQRLADPQRLAGPRRHPRIWLVAVPAVVAILVFAPWAIRDWLVFGSPLPGQALANALSLTGFDIFAWSDPPTLARYLAVGPGRLLEMRIEGIGHNLLDVLVLPGFPIALIGLAWLPRVWRSRSLRPLVAYSVITFLVTSLVFPVSTTWGTFLHAAGAIHVLLVVACLAGLDALVARVGAWRHWTRPVAWLGSALAIAAALAFSLTLGTYAQMADDVAARYQALAVRMTAIGRPLDASAGPVITDFPIWLAEAARISTLALPDEPPASVVQLAAAFPGTRYLVIAGDHGRWPGVLAAGTRDAACFRPIDLGVPSTSADRLELAGVRVYEIGCLR